jgi:hypothetical protein
VPDLYEVRTPMYEKRGCIRTLTTVQCRVPHECILDDATIDEARAEEWAADCPDFFESDTAKNCIARGYERAAIIPISLYFDGVRYTKNDQFVGFYIENLYSRRKYLLAALRPCLNYAMCDM